MIGKKIKLLISTDGQQTGDEGIIQSSCGCAVPGWKVLFGNMRTIEVKQHNLGRTYVLVEEVKEAV